MKLIDKLSRPELLRYALPLCGIVIISRTFPQFSAVYYLLPLFPLWFAAAAWKYISVKEFKTLMILAAVSGIWILLTSLWSDYPLISLSRGGYFILLSIGLIAGGYLSVKDGGSPAAGFLLWANTAVAALSLFSFITDIPADAWTGGHGKGFMGFAGHQNLLASGILFTVPASVYFFLLQKSPSKFISGSTFANLLSVFLLLLNIFFLIITYSRASLLSYIIMIMLFGLFLFKWKAVVAYIIFAAAIAALFYFDVSFRNSFEKTLLKDFPTLLFSREILVEPSWHAALKGGAAGIGYGISDPDIILPGETGSAYFDGRYVREKGNSVLALVEETGVIGLILFLLPVLYVMKNSLSSLKRSEEEAKEKGSPHLSPSLNNAFLFSAVIAFIIHAQFEAWWVGPGSVQLPLFFIYLGALAATKEEPVIGH
jgi:O-antigen ligase